MTSLLFFLLMLPAGPPSARAQQALDPVATVAAFWKATLAMRWPEAVELLDLSDLKTARRMELQAARTRSRRPSTVEDLMRRDPDMPREAAEYEVRRRERFSKQFPQRDFPNFAGIDSAAQLERMPLEAVGVRWLQAHDPIWLVQQQWRTNGCPASEWADSLVTRRHAAVYGAMPAEPDTAYVLFKMDWVPIEDMPAAYRDAQRPQFAIVRRSATGWRIRALESLLEGTGLSMDLGRCPRP